MDMVEGPLGDIVVVEEVRQQIIQLRPLRPDTRRLYTRLYLDLAKAELDHCSVNVADAFGLIRPGDRVKVLGAEQVDGGGTEWSIHAFCLFGDYQLVHAAVQEVRGGSGVILSANERRSPMPKHRRFFAADEQLPCPPEKLGRGQVCLIRHSIRGNGLRDDGDNFFFLTHPGTPPSNELLRRIVAIQPLAPVSQRLHLQLFKAYEDGRGGWEFLGRTEDEKIVCQIAPSIIGLPAEKVDGFKKSLADGLVVWVWVEACPRLPADGRNRESIHLRATSLCGVGEKEEGTEAETEETRERREEERAETTSEGGLGTAYERAETASMTSEPRDGLARTKSIAARARLSLPAAPPPAMESATITAAQDLEIAARVAEAPGPWGALIPCLREFIADFGEPVYDIIALYQNPDAVMLQKKAAKTGMDEEGWDEAEDELPFGCDYKQFRLLRKRQKISLH